MVVLPCLLATHTAQGTEADGRAKEVLGAHDCIDVTRSRVVRRVCYDEFSQRMIVEVGGTYREFCDVDRATAEGFVEASSMSKYFSRLRRTHSCAR
jgi:KTSC domain